MNGRYRMKPLVVEAVQYDGENLEEVRALVGSHLEEQTLETPGVRYCFIRGDGCRMHAAPGDWILRRPQGDFMVCKPGVFAANYKPVE